MKILVTAGGTEEKIDGVRCITNHSTGAMGRSVAQAFLRFEQVEKVLYVCGKSALAPPSGERTDIRRVSDVKDLRETLERLLAGEKPDGVVHCMAVSDYTVDAVVGTDTAESLFASGLAKLDRRSPDFERRALTLFRESLRRRNLADETGKISSDMDGLILTLKRTPKIIDLFKRLRPGAVLVGFKLLNHADEKSLIGAGLGLMKRSGCDFVLANDLKDVDPEHHSGYLIRSGGQYEKISGRERIAEEIASGVVRRIGHGGNAEP